MEKYLEYKDSGIEWIGEIPTNWNKSLVKYEFINLDSKRKPINAESRGDMMGEYDYYGASGVIDKIDDYIFDEALLLIGEDGANLVMRNLPLIYVAKGKYWVNNHAHILKPFLRNDLMYMAYQLELTDLTTYITGSAQPKLTQENLSSIPVIVPNNKTQKVIASYLNCKTAQIDSIIENKENLNELLKEKRQAIISEAVTRGLDPSVPMKDSGVDWIGQIPEHWEISRGKNILSLMKRPVIEKSEVITCFRDGEVTLRSKRREDGYTFADKEIGYQGILIGDLVVHGMDGFAGAIGVSDSNGKGSPVLNVCATQKGYSAYYFMYYLRDLAQHNVFLALSTGIRERSCDLRWNKIADIIFPIPPKKEQDDIAQYIIEKSLKIDGIIGEVSKQVALLKEYRQSIISEAVTGKVAIS